MALRMRSCGGRGRALTRRDGRRGLVGIQVPIRVGVEGWEPADRPPSSTHTLLAYTRGEDALGGDGAGVLGMVPTRPKIRRRVARGHLRDPPAAAHRIDTLIGATVGGRAYSDFHVMDMAGGGDATDKKLTSLEWPPCSVLACSRAVLPSVSVAVVSCALLALRRRASLSLSRNPRLLSRNWLVWRRSRLSVPVASPRW